MVRTPSLPSAARSAAGYIGKSRGQSFWIWFTVGLVLPLLGNLAAALSRNENDEPRRLCPYCQTVCMAYQAKCMKCATELDYPTEEQILPSVNELRALRPPAASDASRRARREPVEPAVARPGPGRAPSPRPQGVATCEGAPSVEGARPRSRGILVPDH